MQYALSRALLACALLGSVALVAAKQQQQQQQVQQQQQQQATKLKRDAALSFGNGIYHGPSHKYLPPVASGYESTYGSLHGNGLASSSGFDFASLDTDNTHHYHHFSHHHHAPQHQSQYASSHGAHGHGHARPVYVSAAGGGASYHHRQQAPKVETYIVQTSNGGAHGHGAHHSSHGLGNGLGSSIGGYKYAGHGAGSGSSSSAGSSFLSLLSGGGGAHKQHGGGGGGASSTTYLLATPSYAHVQRPSLSHGLSLGGAHHFAPALSHGLEQEEHTGGYSYEAPSVHFKQPLSSYGVPLLPGYEHSQHAVEEELAEPQQQHEQHEHQSEHAHKSHLGGDQQTPVYALGHKGLGHFTYTSSKPHALNTDIHHLAATSGVSVGDHNDLVAELTKAPFKPSAFLGAKHEPSQGYEYATPSTQYLQPPTATGYDYPAPSVLYGAPGQSGDSATPIFEPESTYLPPVTSYGAPATPAHSYH